MSYGVADLDVPLDRRVGKKTAAAFGKVLGVETVGDLLRHYPRKYLLRGELTDLSILPLGEHATVLARVVQATGRRMAARPGYLLTVTVGDDRRTLSLAFFSPNQGLHRAREEALTPGRVGLFSGKVGLYQGSLQLVNPMYDLFSADASADDMDAVLARPIPIYAAGAGLQSWEIAKATQTLVTGLQPMPDALPDDVRARHGYLPLHEALIAVHAPESMPHAQKGRSRLRYEEAFVMQAALLRRRAAQSRLRATPRVPTSGGLLETFDASLPFTLTDGQQVVGLQVATDLASSSPMHRLLQGEVGSGKTIVALRAMITAVDGGAQAVLLAPTEVLATQHHRSITAMLGPLAEGGLLGGSDVGTQVVLLTGSQPAPVRRKALLAIASGEAGIVVGTHALLQKNVSFAELGLVVVDEQHRFGVEQRDVLRAKAPLPPHLLVMTATPIPRTVAMTVFGDLETSTLTELPRGRSPIATHVVATDNPAWLARSWQRVAEEVAAGHQAFVVCPRIGDDEVERAGVLTDEDFDDLLAGEPAAGDDGRRPAVSVADALEALRVEPALDGLRIEVLHGRLPADVRAEVMGRFAAGEVDVLVATTVIEVGVDVPNATVMVVLDADRFGISQLHQLRGRVGRGGLPGLCLLLTHTHATSDPAGLVPSPSRVRLDALARTSDGFELSRVDLEQRREGDVLGRSQSGFRSTLTNLRVLRDETTIVEAREAGEALLDQTPDGGEDLAGFPRLRAAVLAMEESVQSAFMEKS